jgi:hypothetical protein
VTAQFFRATPTKGTWNWQPRAAVVVSQDRRDLAIECGRFGRFANAGMLLQKGGIWGKSGIDFA